MKRSGFMKRGKGLKRTSLRPVSRTRDRDANVAYQATCADIARRHPGCETPFCAGTGGSRETHHLVKRGHFGRKTRAERDHPNNLFRLCRRCHAWTDASPTEVGGRLAIYALGAERYRVYVETATSIRGVRLVSAQAMYARPQDSQEVPPCPPDPAATS